MSNSKIQLSAKHYKRLGLIMMISGVLLIAIIIILLIVLKGSLSTSAGVFALVGTFLVIGGLALIIAGVVFVLKSLTAPKTVPPITAKQIMGKLKVTLLILLALALCIVVGVCVVDVVNLPPKGLECSVCDREFTDSANMHSITNTGMCNQCYENYQWAANQINN